MDTLHEDGDRYNADFSGGECVGISTGYHETGPEFSGDVPLDPQGDDMEMHMGIQWAFGEVPALRCVTPMPKYERQKVNGVESFKVEWMFVIRDGELGEPGTTYGTGTGDTATAAIRSAVSNYRDTLAAKASLARARALDNAASVATSAELAVA